MPANPEPWIAEDAFVGIAAPHADETAGVTVQPLSGLGLASVLARRGKSAELAARVSTLYGVTAPEGPRRAYLGSVALVGIAPGGWLAISEADHSDWAIDLAENLKGLASVSDQSDGYAALRVQGPAVRDMLAKGVFLDLHPDAFPPGAAAVTIVAHIGVILWRRDAETFEILCFRSNAYSLWHWVEESAAEFGLAILAPAR
jgi:sarcosine oxidase subunit gamma